MIRKLKNPYSLRCIAEHFAKAIREKRPRGPYMLGGWCAHGVLALETAQILREQGEDVALLVLLETINPERLRKQRRFVACARNRGAPCERARFRKIRPEKRNPADSTEREFKKDSINAEHAA